MATLKEIRTRLQVVQNIQQITAAMKMVAGARLKKAQQLAEGNRPYEATIERMLQHLLRDENLPSRVVHEFCEKRSEVKKVGLLLVTSDKGLCGSLNSNIIRYGQRWCLETQKAGREPVLVLCGRKGNEYFKRRPFPIAQFYKSFFKEFSYTTVQEVSRYLGERFLLRELDEVYMLYSRFQTVISQKVTLKKILPITLEHDEKDPVTLTGLDVLLKPQREHLISELLQRTVDIEVYHGMLEAIASEHGARMAGMEAATKNAEEMISVLTLQRNRARQAAITKELMEIVGGAEALQAQ